MTFLQNLWRDLIDKRLLPVAAALVAALVIVPFVVGSGSNKPAASAAAPISLPAGSPAAPSAAQVSLDDSTSSKATDRPGAVRNPFKPEHVVPPPKTGGPGAGAGTTTTTPAVPAGATGGPSKSAGSGTSSSTTKPPATTTTTTKSSQFLYDWQTQVRIGRHAAMKTYLARGVTLLPSSRYILLSYIGVKKDHTTAVFNVAPGTFVTGGGKCLPSAAKCAVLELASGKSALLTHLSSATHVKRYRIRIESVKMHKITDSATTAKAKAARALTHDDVTAGAFG